MKVGLVISTLEPRRGGAELWTFELAKRLVQRGHEVHVVASGFSELTRRVAYIPHHVECARSRLAFATAAEAKLKNLSLDVVHDIGMGWYCDIYQAQGGVWQASTEAKALSLPRWAKPLKRASMKFLPRYQTFRKLAARQFANSEMIVVAISRMVAQETTQFHGVEPERIRVVYNGVDTEQFSPKRRPHDRERLRRRFGFHDGETVFIFVGNDYHRKGLAAAVRATSRLKREGLLVRLLVVGGKSYRRVSYALRGLNDSSLVTFTGLVDDSAPYYAAADAFVLPTLYDAFALSVIEAAASGIPPITTRMAGAAELLTDGADGYVLDDPCDVTTLAERMRRLVVEPALRRRMGEASRILAHEHSLERNCDEIVEVYHEAIRTGRIPA